VKQEIIKALSHNHFINAIENESVTKDSASNNPPINFIECVFDEKSIFSHTQINNLKYLLVQNKQVFEDLFKNETSNTFNSDAIKYLVSTMKNNQLHSLLNIISHLLKHDVYAEKKKLIINLVLKRGHESKYFLDSFYRFLLIMNEVSKATDIDVNDILEFLNHDQYQSILYSNIQKCHENLAGFHLDYFVDYTKLGNAFQGAEYSKVCWMVKMLGLTYIAYCKEQHKENMNLLINSYFDKLIDAMIYLKQWKISKQLKDGQKDHGAAIIDNIDRMIYFLPPSFLVCIGRYLMKMPQAFVNLHFYGRFINDLIINVKGPMADANRYGALIDILASKFNIGVDMNSSAIKTLLYTQPHEFNSALMLLKGLTHESNGFSPEDRIVLAKLIFTKQVSMQLFIMMGVRFGKKDNFFKEDVLDILEHVERTLGTIPSNTMRNAYANIVNQMIPTLNVRTSASLFFVMLTLIDTLYKNGILEKYGHQLFDLCLSEEFKKYILEKQSTNPDGLQEILQEYFVKILDLPIRFVKPNQPTSNDAIGAMPPSLSQSPHATFPPPVNDNKAKGETRTAHTPSIGEKRKI
jgi:hypothetical protein